MKWLREEEREKVLGKENPIMSNMIGLVWSNKGISL